MCYERVQRCFSRCQYEFILVSESSQYPLFKKKSPVVGLGLVAVRESFSVLGLSDSIVCSFSKCSCECKSSTLFSTWSAVRLSESCWVRLKLFTHVCRTCKTDSCSFRLQTSSFFFSRVCRSRLYLMFSSDACTCDPLL